MVYALISKDSGARLLGPRTSMAASGGLAVHSVRSSADNQPRQRSTTIKVVKKRNQQVEAEMRTVCVKSVAVGLAASIVAIAAFCFILGAGPEGFFLSLYMFAHPFAYPPAAWLYVSAWLGAALIFGAGFWWEFERAYAEESNGES
jgi:hypothetical protein